MPFRQDFTTPTLVMIPVAIAINIAVGQLIYTLKIPLYLDSIGQFCSCAGRPIGGCIDSGLLTNLDLGTDRLERDLCPVRRVAAVIGLLAGLFAEAGWFRARWGSGGTRLPDHRTGSRPARRPSRPMCSAEDKQAPMLSSPSSAASASVSYRLLLPRGKLRSTG